MTKPAPLYLSTIPPPALKGTDAVLQDVNALMRHFGGRHISLYPLRKPSRFVPHWAMGWLNRPAIWQAARDASVIHVFSATLNPIPALIGLGRPIVYTVTASVGTRPRTAWFTRHNVALVVNNERDYERLLSAGGANAHLIRPGMDLSGFIRHAPPAIPPFRLMIGSAPWTRAQFRTKGIDALIDCARRMPDLHLIFLWRNLFLDELHQRIQHAGIGERVTIHNTRVDVNAVLAHCHATAVLALHERLVKAWPHSAIESLATGTPVLLGQAIPMSAYVEQNRFGVSTPSLKTHDLDGALARLRTLADAHDDKTISRQAHCDFAAQAMCDAHAQLYAQRYSEAAN